MYVQLAIDICVCFSVRSFVCTLPITAVVGLMLRP